MTRRFTRRHAARRVTPDTRSILRFIIANSGRYRRDEIIAAAAPRHRKGVATLISSLMLLQTIVRIDGDRLAPSGKAFRILTVKRRVNHRTALTAKTPTTEPDWLQSPLEGKISTERTRLIRLRTRARAAPIDPLRMARRLYVEGAVEYAPRLREYLFRLRTRSSEFRRDEKAIVIDLDHASAIHEWLGRAIQRIKKQEVRRL